MKTTKTKRYKYNGRCRLVGHWWQRTCIGTWGNDDWWTCAYCTRDSFEQSDTPPSRWRGTYIQDAARQVTRVIGFAGECMIPIGLVLIIVALVVAAAQK